MIVERTLWYDLERPLYNERLENRDADDRRLLSPRDVQ
jgi:hypothetical protein